MSAAPLPPPGEPVTAADVREGRVALRHAQSAERLGSVFANVVPTGWPTGPCVVLVGQDALALATGEYRATFSSAEGWAPLLGARFGRAVVNADDPEHAADRRRWAGAFTPAELERCLAAVRALVARRVEALAAAPAFEAYAATRELAFAAVGTTLGGFADDATLARALALLAPVLDPSAPGETEIERHHRVAPLRDALETLLRAHLATAAAAGAAPSLIAHLRRNDPTLGTEALLAHLNLLLLTGLETSASLMAWLLRYAAMPVWRDWLREELDAPGTPAGLLPLTALEALPRTDAFVREAGRLRPPVLCAPRVCVRDAVVAGVQIPAGSRVVLSYCGTNLLESAFPDPQAFRPQRWLEPRPPRAVTFGAGHRQCLGMRFALMEAKTMLVHVLAHYDIARDESVEPFNAGFWNARPTGGLRMALRPRASVHASDQESFRTRQHADPAERGTQ